MSRRIALTTARSNLVAGVLALVVTAGAGWGFLIGPATADLADTRTDLVDTVDVNRLLAVKLRGLQRQGQELATTATQAEALAVAFPPTADQPGFFAMVDRAAAAAGIGSDQVTALSPTAPVPALAGEETEDTDVSAAESPLGLLAVQTVVVNVEAPYEDLQRLLKNLERMDRAFLVQEVALTSDDDATAVQITGTTYVAPPLLAPDLDPEEPADADDAADPAGDGDVSADGRR